MGHQPLMPETIQEQKRAIIEKGIKEILKESSIPQRMHLQVVQALKTQISDYQKELKDAADSRGEHESLLSAHASSFDEFSARVNTLIESLEQEVERLTTIDHLKGDDGTSVDINDVLPHLIPHLPEAEKVDHKKIVMDVLDMMPVPEKEEVQELDTEALFKDFVSRIQKERLIDVSHIKNAESFIFNGKKYKIEELMRGAGGSTGTGGTPYTPTGTVNAVNTVFGVTAEPSSVVSDGITYYEGNGYSYSANNITLDVPPSQYIRYYT